MGWKGNFGNEALKLNVLINREKTIAKLLALQQNLMKRARGEVVKGKKPTFDSVEKAVEGILKTEYMKDIISYEVVVFEPA